MGIKKLIREPKPSTKFIFVYNHVDSTIWFSSFSGFRKEKKILETPDGGSRRGFQTGIPDGDFKRGPPKVDANSSTHDHTNPQS